MVTAGVFMVCRMSPLFEHSEFALNFVMLIGAITCLFTGVLGIVQNDIKRIIAYSTLSQLGYMMVAAGASAYSVAIFHLATHAFFKALLFLAAGSVIIGMHHEQNIQKMGNLKRYMPVTYVCMLLGTLALVGFPGFSGFFSKDFIIAATHASQLPSAKFAYAVVLGSVFVTSLYSFRLLFLVFHTKERYQKHNDDSHDYHSHTPHESSWVILVPLLLLAIPSVIIALPFARIVLQGFFGAAITVLPVHDTIIHISSEYNTAQDFILHGFTGTPFYLLLLGFITAFISYIMVPKLPNLMARIFMPIYQLLTHKYWFDEFNQNILVRGIRGIGSICTNVGDKLLIDGYMVNGSARMVGRVAQVVRRLQTGYLYHYALLMIFGFFALLVWLLWS
jgi:NADH-quinone oxidoreductase subunit L